MADLRVGTFLASNIMPVYETITAGLEERLGVTAELVVETDYEACRNDINDVCFVCSLPYVAFEQEGIDPSIPIAAPVLQGDRYRGRPVYFSDVIVRRGSDIDDFGALRGRSWAYNEPLSHSGYGITRFHLVQLGETNGFFGEVVEAGYHETSIEMVRDDRVDASAIDSQVLAVAMRDDPDLANSLTIIDSLGPSTIQPMAVSRRLADDLRAEIAAIVLDMHTDPRHRVGFDRGLVDRFVPVGPEDYDDIRMMLRACEEASFLELR